MLSPQCHSVQGFIAALQLQRPVVHGNDDEGVRDQQLLHPFALGVGVVEIARELHSHLVVVQNHLVVVNGEGFDDEVVAGLKLYRGRDIAIALLTIEHPITADKRHRHIIQLIAIAPTAKNGVVVVNG